MAILSLDLVAAAPWGEELLQDINLELDAGQVLAILGPNGAGKTSLLNLLCGAVTPTRGDYRFGGRPMADWPISQRACSQAVLPQHSSLNFPYTVEEVILLGRTPHASGATCDRLILDEVLAATDTLYLRDRLYTQLSGGEKQRVQLGRAFAQVWRAADSDLRLLMLDEPTAALDLSHQVLILDQLRSMARQGCAVVMVVHDFNLAARYADLCLVLHNGHQRALGAPSEIFTPALFEDVFSVPVTISRHPTVDVPLVIST
jgi:iron complex transport system ATP-binding protein